MNFIEQARERPAAKPPALRAFVRPGDALRRAIQAEMAKREQVYGVGYQVER